MLKRTLTAMLMIAMAGQAVAQAANADLYTCMFTDTRNKILPDRVLVAQDDKTKEYRVADPFLQYFNETADLEPRLIKDNAKMLNLSWKYRIKDNRGTQASVLFTMIIQRNSGRATIRSRVPGYANHDSSRGKCTVRRGRI